jgi:hypothetical protein
VSLDGKQCGNDDDGYRDDPPVQRWSGNAQSFDGAEYRNCRSDDPITIQQCSAEQTDRD